jgi:copper transport protein
MTKSAKGIGAALRGGSLALVVLAHAYLVASSPADGDVLQTSPRSIRLIFSEPVEAALSTIVVVSARDSIALRVRADSTDARLLIGDPPPLAPADYRVDWRTVSADGHPVEGSLRFHVLPRGGSDDTIPSPGQSDPPARPHADIGHAHAGPTVLVGVSAALRGLAMFSLLVLAGWLIQLVALRSGPPVGALRAALLLAVAATVLLTAHFCLWLWNVTPVDRAPDLAVALRTTPGRVEAVRLGLALVGLGVIAFARRPGIALGLALAAVLVSGATGHSAGIVPRWSIPIKALHLVAVAAWLGGVAWLALAALASQPFRESAVRVSGMALGAVLLVGLTGVAQAALFLPGPDALLSSTYGRLVLAKAVGLAGLVAFGAHNRRRLLPSLAAGAEPGALRRSTRRELALMLAVSLVAGVLAYVPPPSG